MLLFAGFVAPVSSNAAWLTRAWNTDDGLPNNNIHAIIQGPDNYLWVMTPYDLMRFDGFSFSRFPIEDFSGPTLRRIPTVLCSRTGVLWFWYVPANGAVFGLNRDSSLVCLSKTGMSPITSPTPG
ncbi:MAG TPA: two-component regulator propeller domain-containing protein [Verrucomicrobiae bacterium]|jgi:ligand-binding sensor domain-containing protein